MTPRRLRAPAVDGGVLVDPPSAAVAGQIAANSSRLLEWDHDFQGRSAQLAARQVRHEVCRRGQSFSRAPRSVERPS